MEVTFLWGPEEPSQKEKDALLKRYKPLVIKEIETDHVATHLRNLERGLGSSGSRVLAAGFSLPRDLIQQLITWKPKLDPKTRTMRKLDIPYMCEPYVSGNNNKQKKMHAEASRMVFLLQQFMAGTLNGFVLVVFSRWFSKKPWLYTFTTVPETILHIENVRNGLRALVDPRLEFSAPISDEIKGMLGLVRWAYDAACLCATDSAYFVEIQFPNVSLVPTVRFNTGRVLNKIENNPWVNQLLRFAVWTVEQNFFREDEPVVFFSIILSTRHRVFTGVRVTDVEASSSSEPASLGTLEDSLSETDVLDGTAAKPPT